MTDTIALLKARRSAPPLLLAGPGPTPSQLDALLAIAARVPDHGKLVPWRFVVFEGEARHKAGEVIARAFHAANLDASDEQLGFERKRLAHAPLVVGVVSRAAPHVKIPLWEQELSAGAACMNLVVAANAMGFSTSWLTQWYAYDRAALDALGVGRDEKMAGFIHIGRATAPVEDRVRPDMAAIVTRFS